MGCLLTKYYQFISFLNETDHKFKVMNRSRKDKKLLVLDLDKTLCDFRPRLPRERPYLHQFLEEMYKTFDIIIWSATPISIVTEKLIWLGVLSHDRYKIMCYVGVKAMITVRSHPNKTIRTKYLNVIWEKYPQYNGRNTIIVDDKKKNFYLNEKNGLLIKRFEAGNYKTDSELCLLNIYLSNMCTFCPNFMIMDHEHWKRNITL